MAATYGVMNMVTSFGFAFWWRRQCAWAIPVDQGMTVVDLMTGQGELFGPLSRRVGSVGRLIGIDLSPVMCGRAEETAQRCDVPTRVLRADALACPLPDRSADAVFCSFGLKTLDTDQTRKLAAEVFRILKPGGKCSFLEISIPPMLLLRCPYRFYLNCCIPFLGKLFLGNPDHYRMLGIYTDAFGNVTQAARLFSEAGMNVETSKYFFGCATGFVARKPA